MGAVEKRRDLTGCIIVTTKLVNYRIDDEGKIMRDVIDAIKGWHEQGLRMALATVVKVYGSAPRALGSKMVINERGEFAGSVSAGCVEGAVIEEARSIFKGGQPRRLEYGISDELAFSVGLTCGGVIHVFLEKLDWEPDEHHVGVKALVEAVEKDETVARVTALAGPLAGRDCLLRMGGSRQGVLPFGEENETVERLALDRLREQQTERLEVALASGAQDVWVEVHAPRPVLVVVGGVHLAIPLVDFASKLGFHTVVVDARKAFANRERFPHADEVLIGWPAEVLEGMKLHENTFIAVVSHDDKLDIPALKAALDSPARYVGALGSKKTQERRREELRQMGVTEENLRRIHGPIGMDIGAATPGEIAVAILAEMIAARRGKG